MTSFVEILTTNVYAQLDRSHDFSSFQIYCYQPSFWQRWATFLRNKCQRNVLLAHICHTNATASWSLSITNVSMENTLKETVRTAKFSTRRIASVCLKSIVHQRDTNLFLTRRTAASTTNARTVSKRRKLASMDCLSTKWNACVVGHRAVTVRPNERIRLHHPVYSIQLWAVTTINVQQLETRGYRMNAPAPSFILARTGISSLKIVQTARYTIISDTFATIRTTPCANIGKMIIITIIPLEVVLFQMNAVLVQINDFLISNVGCIINATVNWDVFDHVSKDTSLTQ